MSNEREGKAVWPWSLQGQQEGEHCVEVLAHSYPGHSDQAGLEAEYWS